MSSSFNDLKFAETDAQTILRQLGAVYEALRRQDGEPDFVLEQDIAMMLFIGDCGHGIAIHNGASVRGGGTDPQGLNANYVIGGCGRAVWVLSMGSFTGISRLCSSTRGMLVDTGGHSSLHGWCR